VHCISVLLLVSDSTYKFEVRSLTPVGWIKTLRTETHVPCTPLFLAIPKIIIGSWMRARTCVCVCVCVYGCRGASVSRVISSWSCRSIRGEDYKGSIFRVPVLRRHLHSPLSQIPICSEISNTCCSAGNLLPMSFYARNTRVSGWLPGRGDPTGSCSREQQTVWSLGLRTALYWHSSDILGSGAEKKIRLIFIGFEVITAVVTRLVICFHAGITCSAHSTLKMEAI
jgi:hypothetical protein